MTEPTKYAQREAEDLLASRWFSSGSALSAIVDEVKNHVLQAVQQGYTGLIYETKVGLARAPLGGRGLSVSVAGHNLADMCKRRIKEDLDAHGFTNVDASFDYVVCAGSSYLMGSICVSIASTLHEGHLPDLAVARNAENEKVTGKFAFWVVTAG